LPVSVAKFIPKRYRIINSDTVGKEIQYLYNTCMWVVEWCTVTLINNTNSSRRAGKSGKCPYTDFANCPFSIVVLCLPIRADRLEEESY
jgi:hypothetical protein